MDEEAWFTLARGTPEGEVKRKAEHGQSQALQAPQEEICQTRHPGTS